MAYNENLAKRIHKIVSRRKGVTEKKMFGGIATMLDGKMTVGINDDLLMVRIGIDHYEPALAKPHVKKMDFTGRALTGFVYVEPKGTKTDVDLKYWIDLSFDYVRTLPAKKKKKKRGKS